MSRANAPDGGRREIAAFKRAALDWARCGLAAIPGDMDTGSLSAARFQALYLLLQVATELEVGAAAWKQVSDPQGRRNADIDSACGLRSRGAGGQRVGASVSGDVADDCVDIEMLLAERLDQRARLSRFETCEPARSHSSSPAPGSPPMCDVLRR